MFSALARSAVWLVGNTMRLRTVGESRLAGFRRQGPGPLLFALWHGDFFPIFHYARGHDICVVVSRSPDGEILARVLERNGYHAVRGSSTRGGTRAVIDLARLVKGGRDAAIAVDGPRGPVGVAKPGIVLLARMTGCPVVPLGVGISRCKQFASWDRFRLPLPLARVVLTTDDPIRVPDGASAAVLEEKRSELQRSLETLGAHAGQLVEPGAFRRTQRPRGLTTSRRR